MTRAEFDTLCAAHPGATLSGPGELDAWKVGGKMFACFGHEETRAENTGTVSLKCPDAETAAMLIEAGAATRAPYFHRSWVQLTLADLTGEEAAHRVAVSYDTIRASLPKKVREAL
ncbi:MmcQ/YjbR family DNA-binding protein [Jannaschia formosa]|uniref:MmcQ/YjbR family DNA-binding protein n=1 Tax=Jannaschia formosa TaxID=2259592 RepID=UPI000E1B82AA|nr:MmcQ/YjbR family DNA-binding protein [Jannaschia formosa]TFL19956.1 MmcQ/YjbR family DNA-binding protein [Jannaschia formosa]